MLEPTPIKFEFQDPVSAERALATLRELGFEAHRADEHDNRVLFLHNVRNSLYTGIEIAQMHGGTLVGREIEIPALGTNGDRTAAYSAGVGEALEMTQLDAGGSGNRRLT